MTSRVSSAQGTRQSKPRPLVFHKCALKILECPRRQWGWAMGYPWVPQLGLVSRPVVAWPWISTIIPVSYPRWPCLTMFSHGKFEFSYYKKSHVRFVAWFQHEGKPTKKQWNGDRPPPARSLIPGPSILWTSPSPGARHAGLTLGGSTTSIHQLSIHLD